MEFLTYLKGEWQVISQAPFTFLTGAVLVALVTYAVVRMLFSDRIGSLESRITLRDDQLSDYKQKLSGATPDEAKRRLDALEIQVQALSPRRLSTEQIENLIAVVQNSPSMIEIAHDAAAGDAKAFTGDFAVAFQRAGWAVSLPMVMGIGRHPATGIALQVADMNELRPAELLVKQALEAVGVSFDVHNGLRQPHPRPQLPRSFPQMPEERHPDVGLLLTSKLT